MTIKLISAKPMSKQLKIFSQLMQLERIQVNVSGMQIS